MTSIEDLIALAPEPRRMAARKHDNNPAAVRDHINCASDRLLHRRTIAECMFRYKLKSHVSVYNYIKYALEYDNPLSDEIRKAYWLKRTA